MYIYWLIVLLTGLIHTISVAETTSNLVSPNFTTGWSGTNSTSLHGTNTIAGVHGQYLESDSVSLNSSGINKESLNEGFTSTGSADYWFWSGAQQSVTQTIKTVDDNNNTLTQTRIVSGTSGTGTTYDKLIIGSNSQQDYNVSLRYDFSIPTYPNYHYAADLSNPSLTVSYTYVAPLDTATQTALLDLNKTITDDLKDVKEVTIESKTIDNKIETSTAEPQLETKSDSSSSVTEISSKEETTQSNNKESSQQQTTDKQEKKEEKTSTPTNSKTSEEQKNEKIEKNESLSASMNKIDQEIKQLDKNLEMKNKLTHIAMIDNKMISVYNIPFYKQEIIYGNQINIADNRILYKNNLSSYIQNDPMVIQQNKNYNIKLEEQRLINEIEVLKNG